MLCYSHLWRYNYRNDHSLLHNAKQNQSMPFIQLFATFLKATAQAVGRVLRHKDDYAAIILLDPRYEQHQKRLPKWLQTPLKIHRNTCTATPSLQDFFRSKQGPTTAPVHEMKMKEEEPLAPPPTVECYLNPSSSQPSLKTSVTQKPKRKKIKIVSPHIMASLSQDESCTSE